MVKINMYSIIIIIIRYFIYNQPQKQNNKQMGDSFSPLLTHFRNNRRAS